MKKGYLDMMNKKACFRAFSFFFLLTFVISAFVACGGDEGKEDQKGVNKGNGVVTDPALKPFERGVKDVSSDF